MVQMVFVVVFCCCFKLFVRLHHVLAVARRLFDLRCSMWDL